MDLVILSEGNEHIYIGIPTSSHQHINKMEKKVPIWMDKIVPDNRMKEKVPTNKQLLCGSLFHFSGYLMRWALSFMRSYAKIPKTRISTCIWAQRAFK